MKFFKDNPILFISQNEISIVEFYDIYKDISSDTKIFRFVTKNNLGHFAGSYSETRISIMDEKINGINMTIIYDEIIDSFKKNLI